MRRQILLSLLPKDAEELIAHIKSRHSVVVVKRSDPDSATVEALSALPASGNDSLVLWNQELLPELKRKRVSGATARDYYRVDVPAQPVLEIGTSFWGRWCGRPWLTQGRIYGVFENKSEHFSRWYEEITRHVRKAFYKNPAATLSGYVGPAAFEWFRQGGLLSPTFLPPDTSHWRKFFDDEDLVRRRLNATSSA
ncbi:MAG: hypothetical protein WA690_09120 [Candidatus Acidiferrales bacterium]